MTVPRTHKGLQERGRDLATLAVEGLWHAEDLQVGDYLRLGSVEVTRAEIIAFASKFDPLSIHLDGADSPFGDVIASGVHTMACFSSMASRSFIPRLALIAGKGMDRLRFPHPVRPGAVLSGSVQVDEVAMRDHRADVIYQATLTDESDRTVLSFAGITVVSRRRAG